MLLIIQYKKANIKPVDRGIQNQPSVEGPRFGIN